MEKVRIAVAGAGSIGIRHIEEIQRSQGAVLSAIIDPSPRRSKSESGKMRRCTSLWRNFSSVIDRTG
jgi:predicted dehydrogenase